MNAGSSAIVISICSLMLAHACQHGHVIHPVVLWARDQVRNARLRVQQALLAYRERGGQVAPVHQHIAWFAICQALEAVHEARAAIAADDDDDYSDDDCFGDRAEGFDADDWGP